MIAENLKRIKASLPDEVTLVAVSKTKPVEMLQEAYDAGQRIFGENRPQEMRDKQAQLPDDIAWHMIGHLQTNKVKYIIDFVDLIHAVDSLKLLEEIDKRAAKADRIVDCLIQVHIAQEQSKFGFDTAEVQALFASGKLAEFEHVKIRGLMGMATFTSDKDQVRMEFDKLKNSFDLILESKSVKTQVFNILSMGMSGDYSIAIAAGSNMVRIGSSIFGSRN